MFLFGYACHPTTLDFDKWCGDYPGFAQIALEENHPETMVLFFTGGGADQNPLPRRKVLFCEQYGNRLAEADKRALLDECSKKWIMILKFQNIPGILKDRFPCNYLGIFWIGFQIEIL